MTKKSADHKERVRIVLAKDNNLLTDDAIVVVNFKTHQIKRGVPVDVPESVYEAIVNSQIEDARSTAVVQDFSKADIQL